jgi:hypothetical protein
MLYRFKKIIVPDQERLRTTVSAAWNNMGTRGKRNKALNGIDFF